MSITSDFLNATTLGKTVEGGHLVDGRFQNESAKNFESTNPSEFSDIVGRFPIATSTDISKAVDSARKAFDIWKDTPVPVRGQIIGRFGALLEKHKGDLAYLVSREVGKTKKEGLGSVQEAIDTAQFFQSEGRRLYGQTVWSEMRNKECYTYRRPLGVVGVITAGNFPIAVPSWKIIPALICGNTVVWKPSEDAPTLAHLFSLLFQEAGLPKGVLNVVHGRGKGCAGEEMIKGIDKGYFQKFSFTGSTSVGRLIGEACGRQLQVPSLELGGKNPLIIMDDAMISKAVEASIFSCYGTGGQRCTSTGNIILHEKIADKFLSDFVSKAKLLKIGNPILDETVDYGPMMNERFHNTFLQHLDMGKADGAQLVIGSGRITSSNKPSHFLGKPEAGYFCTPTIWDRVNMKMNLAQTEVFGPTVNIVRVKSFEEAMSCANGTAYGLSSAIFTENTRLMYKFKNGIQAGMSSINNSTTGAEAHLPFGGSKASGNGTRESGVWVLDSYTYWHAVNLDLSETLQKAQIDTEGFS